MRGHIEIRAIVNNVLIPSLGARPVVAISYAELRGFRNARIDAPRMRGGKTIVRADGSRSIARVNRELAVLRAVLNHAVELRLIDRNPMNAGRGKALIVPQAEQPRDRVLSVAEERALLAAYDGNESIRRSRDFVVALIDTGLRCGEALAVEARDIDLSAHVIRLRWETTKSKRARAVPISARVQVILARRMATTADGRVFGDLTYTVARNDFRVAKTKAEISDLRLHDLRTTFATRLLMRGLTERAIAGLTGHSVGARDGLSAVLSKHYLHPLSDGGAFDAVRASLDSIAEEVATQVN